MKQTIFLISLLGIFLVIQGCSSFEAKRVSSEESDELAMEITDQWVAKDTELAIQKTLKQLDKHKGFQRYMSKRRKPPKLFICEVQNMTSEAYFPIDDMNDELLTEFSMTGDFTLVDAAARDKLLEEITYQNDGMVSAREAKTIGKQAGADLMIFGAVRMKPKTRKGKTIKEYSVNFRMTDIEKGVEVLRTRVKMNKYSEQSGSGW